MNLLHNFWEAAHAPQELTEEKKKQRMSKDKRNMNDCTGCVQRHQQTK